MKSLFEQMSDTYRKENGYLAVIDKQVEDMFLLLVKNIFHLSRVPLYPL